MKLDDFVTPYTKINSKQIKDLKVSLEIITILEKSTCSNFSDMSFSNIFIYMSPQAKETKAKINYWDDIKINKQTTKNSAQ